MCFHITNLVMSVTFLMPPMAPHCLQSRMRISQLAGPSSSKSGFHYTWNAANTHPKHHASYKMLKYFCSSNGCSPSTNQHPAHMSPGQSPGGRDATSVKGGIWHWLPSGHKPHWGPWHGPALPIDALAWAPLGTTASTVHTTPVVKCSIVNITPASVNFTDLSFTIPFFICWMN